MNSLSTGAHDDDHAVSLWIALVFKQAVTAAGTFGETLKQTIDDLRNGVIKQIRRLARLEEHIRILRRAPDDRLIWSKRALPVGLNCYFGNQTAQVVITDFRNLRHFM